MKLNLFTSTLVGTLILSVFSVLSPPSSKITLTGDYLIWTLVSNLMIVILLGVFIKNSSNRGMTLTLLVLAIHFVIGNFNLLIEAYIFNVTPRSETLEIMATGLVSTLITSPLLVLIFGRWNAAANEASHTKRSVLQWTWRIIAGNLLYVFFYLLAGFILYAVYPRLMDFYGDKIPELSVMINTQFFRALLFIGVAILIDRNVNLSLFYKALLTGFIFSIVGGIAPLILPHDELMPAYIRFGHAFEVGFSNLLYGIILTYLIGQRTAAYDNNLSEIKNQVTGQAQY